MAVAVSVAAVKVAVVGGPFLEDGEVATVAGVMAAAMEVERAVVERAAARAAVKAVEAMVAVVRGLGSEDEVAETEVVVRGAEKAEKAGGMGAGAKELCLEGRVVETEAVVMVADMVAVWEPRQVGTVATVDRCSCSNSWCSGYGHLRPCSRTVQN